MKSNSICSSKLLVLLLVVLLTIIVVHISLNSFNREMYTNFVSDPSNAHFNSRLISQELQNQVNTLGVSNPALADNYKLSAMHLNQVYETGRPELIVKNQASKEQLCYINLQQ